MLTVLANAKTVSSHLLIGCAAILAVSVTAGCNRGLVLIKVTGKVNVDGKPANGAVVLFHPESPELTVVPSAVAKEDGSISPVTDSLEGIPEGSYQVTVSWPDPSVKSSFGSGQFGGGDAADPPDLLKGRYISKDRSGLSVKVDSSTSALAPFELSTR